MCVYIPPSALDMYICTSMYVIHNMDLFNGCFIVEITTLFLIIKRIQFSPPSLTFSVAKFYVPFDAAKVRRFASTAPRRSPIVLTI